VPDETLCRSMGCGRGGGGARGGGYLLKGACNVAAFRQGLVVGEHQGVHVGRHVAQQALQGVLGSPRRVHQLVRVDVQDPVDAVLGSQLDALCGKALRWFG